MENQEQFIAWLSEKLQAADETDLQNKLKSLGEEGIKQAYEVFMKESDGAANQVQAAKLGAKLKHLACLQQFKKGGSAKVDCGCSNKKKTITMKQQGGALPNQLTQVSGKPNVYQNGNGFTSPAPDVQMTPPLQGRQALAQPAVAPTAYFNIGRGSQQIQVPQQDIINQLKDPNSRYKTTRTDWAFDNPVKMQLQLDYDDRVDGSGVHQLRGLATRNVGGTNTPWKGPQPQITTPSTLPEVTNKFNDAIASRKKGGTINGKTAVLGKKAYMKDSETALNKNNNSKTKDSKTTLNGYKINALKDMKSTVRNKKSVGKDNATAVK